MNPFVILTGTFLCLGAGVYLSFQIVPVEKAFRQCKALHDSRVKKFSTQFEDIFYAPSYKLILFLVLLPLVIGGIAFYLTKNLIVLGIGLVIGHIIPSFFIKFIKARRAAKFDEQLVDALMGISNSLKGGLSIIQALEEMAKDNAPPLKDEFGLALRANKMGVPLEGCLQILNKRMNSEYLELMTTAILVGKEMGGNLIRVFSKLVSTIRERKKLKDKMKVMTFQGRFQALIISILPIAFTMAVYKMDPHHFDIMLATDIGRVLLIIAGVLFIIALILIKKFSTLKY